MTNDHPDLGWADPVGMFVSLEAAVRILCEGRGQSHPARLGIATGALVKWQAADFPARLKAVATRTLAARDKATHYGPITHVRLTPRQRAGYVRDLLALYRECLLDMGSTRRWDEVFPEDGETVAS